MRIFDCYHKRIFRTGSTVFNFSLIWITRRQELQYIYILSNIPGEWFVILEQWFFAWILTLILNISFSSIIYYNMTMKLWKVMFSVMSVCLFLGRPIQGPSSSPNPNPSHPHPTWIPSFPHHTGTLLDISKLVQHGPSQTGTWSDLFTMFFYKKVVVGIQLKGLIVSIWLARVKHDVLMNFIQYTWSFSYKQQMRKNPCQYEWSHFGWHIFTRNRLLQ